MKRFTVLTAALLLSATCMAQTMGDEPCPVDGAVATRQGGQPKGTSRCEPEPQQPKTALHGAAKRFRINYVLAGEGWSHAGSTVADDGASSRVADTTETPYVASATRRDGKLVVDQRVLAVGYAMQFEPKLAQDGTVTMVIGFSESAVSKASAQEPALANDAVELAKGVDVSHVLVMEPGKEAQLPVRGIAVKASAQYTLKVVATEI